MLEIPANDKRAYHTVTLPNGLSCLLISDPNTDKAAAAVGVGVGQLHDGLYPGIAHLTEHLLFLGTERFPVENEYDRYLSAAGGHSNAYTDLELTCYYMDCQTASLEGALDRFSACLVAPLCHYSSLEKEIQAVDSEHAKNVQNDHWRSMQLSKTVLGDLGGGDLGDAGGDAGGDTGGDLGDTTDCTKVGGKSCHPYAGFGSGNLETLLPMSTKVVEVDATDENAAEATDAKNAEGDTKNDDPKKGDDDANKEAKQARILQLREAVWDFYTKYYYAANMTLTVLGKESIETLEQWVSEYFGPLRTAALESSTTPPVCPALCVTHLPRQLQWVPTRPLHTLELQWPCPELQTKYLSKPMRILSHLLGHEGPGSLLAALRCQDQQWVQELSADDVSKQTKSFSVFTLQMELTDQGLAHQDTVIQMVFYYIDVILKNIPAWVSLELKEQADMQFRFLSEQPAADYVAGVAAHMHLYKNPNHYLSGPYKVYESDSALVETCRACLTPQNVLVSLASPTVAGCTDQTDPWYGTEYSVQPVEADRVAKWNPANLSPELAALLSLPAQNDMLATNFELVSAAAGSAADGSDNGDDEISKQGPRCIADTDTLRLWYKPDDQFKMPKVNFMCLLRTNTVYAEGPTASVLASLWSEVVHEQCNVFSYAASMAGLHCDFGNSRKGIEIDVSGYNEKAGVLLERIVKAIRDMPSQLTEELFGRIQDKLEKQFTAFMVAQPYQHAMYAVDLCLERPKYPILDRLAALKEVTMADLVRFNERLVSRVQLEVLVHGNVTAEETKKWVRILTDAWNPKPAFSLPQLRVVQLDPGTDYVYRLEGMNDQDSNSCVSTLFQMGAVDVRTNAAVSLLQHLLREPAFNQLRTEEQLGYIVHSSVKTNGENIKGLAILIQSDSFDPIHLDERIEVFLLGFRTKLVEMTAEDFEANVDSVCQNLTQKDKNLGEESSKYWQVITNRTYHFCRLADIAAQARTVSKTEVLRLFDRYILRGSPNRKKLSVQIFGNNHLERLNEETDAVKITDPIEFGQGQSLFPVPSSVSVEKFMLAGLEEN
jgi:insulysin